MNWPPNPTIGVPPQLLIDLFGWGSGMGDFFASVLGRLPRKEALSLRKIAIEHAQHGQHWLGPRALSELLAVATNEAETRAARANAVGALARAVCMWRHRPAPASYGLPASQTADNVIWQARILLRVEDRAHPDWIATPPLIQVQSDPPADGAITLRPLIASLRREIGLEASGIEPAQEALIPRRNPNFIKACQSRRLDPFPTVPFPLRNMKNDRSEWSRASHSAL